MRSGEWRRPGSGGLLLIQWETKVCVCVCVSGVNRVKGIVAHGEVLTAVCTHCHAAESSVIYSVIGA